MAQMEIAARKRAETGKGPAKRMRRNGWVPAVLYGHGRDVKPLAIEARQIRRALEVGAHVVAIRLVDDATDAAAEGDLHTSALIREVQVQPVSQDILHVDFQAVSAHELIDITVPIILRGQAAGVKEGGVLDVILHEIEVRCPADAVFDELRVNVSDLELGQALHVRELALPESAEAVTPVNQIVVVVRRPREEEEEEVAAAGTEVPEQPEVIGEKEREERQAEKGAAEKGKSEKGKSEKGKSEKGKSEKG